MVILVLIVIGIVALISLVWIIEVILISNGDSDEVHEYYCSFIHGNGRDIVSVREFE